MCQTASPRSKETKNEIPALLRAWKHFLKLCTLPTCHALPRGEEGLSDRMPHPLSLIKQEEGDQGLQTLSIHSTNSHKLQIPTQPGRAPDILGPTVGLSPHLVGVFLDQPGMEKHWPQSGNSRFSPKFTTLYTQPAKPPDLHYLGFFNTKGENRLSACWDLGPWTPLSIRTSGALSQENIRAPTNSGLEFQGTWGPGGLEALTSHSTGPPSLGTGSRTTVSEDSQHRKLRAAADPGQMVCNMGGHHPKGTPCSSSHQQVLCMQACG